jgi:hypothetical protein
VGVTACGELAHKPEIVAEVLIAGENFGERLDRPFPKLFVAGEIDEWAGGTESAYEAAAKPKKLVLYESNPAHGTMLFSSSDGPAFIDLLKTFIADNG